MEVEINPEVIIVSDIYSGKTHIETHDCFKRHQTPTKSDDGMNIKMLIRYCDCDTNQHKDRCSTNFVS